MVSGRPPPTPTNSCSYNMASRHAFSAGREAKLLLEEIFFASETMICPIFRTVILQFNQEPRGCGKVGNAIGDFKVGRAHVFSNSLSCWQTLLASDCSYCGEASV